MPGPSSPDGVATRYPAAELGGQHVDLLQRLLHTAELHGQRVRGVVAGCISNPCSSWLTVQVPPSSTPTLVPSAAASSAVPTTDLLRGSALREAIATSTLMTLAGRCRPC